MTKSSANQYAAIHADGRVSRGFCSTSPCVWSTACECVLQFPEAPNVLVAHIGKHTHTHTNTHTNCMRPNSQILCYLFIHLFLDKVLPQCPLFLDTSSVARSDCTRQANGDWRVHSKHWQNHLGSATQNRLAAIAHRHNTNTLFNTPLLR